MLSEFAMYESITATISALGNLLMAGAAIAGAMAAFLGLSTWRNQSLWQADNELAKRALIAIYSYRDSLFAVRHPAMSNSEMELTDEEKNGISAGGDKSAGVINAYAKRWERHSSSKNSLEVILVEADAVWGGQLRERVEPLKKLEHELYAYILLHADAHWRGPTELAKQYREILKTKRDILYDLLDNEKDDFRVDFKNGLGPVEEYLRNKLGRHQ